MRLLLLISIFLSSLFSSEIINTTYYNYKDENKVVVLFSLDNPFNGKISKIDKNTYLISNVKTLSVETKKFHNVIESIIISPNDENSVKLKIFSNNDFSVKASMTKVGYGLKITILSKNKTTKSEPLTMPNITTAQNSSFSMFNYILVMSILVILIIILLIIKKKGIKVPMKNNEYNYKIIFKRAIDTKNSLMMIEVMGVKYLMIIGNSNVLLNVIDGQADENVLKDLSTQTESFEELLNKQANSTLLDSYKSNASKIKE